MQRAVFGLASWGSMRCSWTVFDKGNQSFFARIRSVHENFVLEECVKLLVLVRI